MNLYSPHDARVRELRPLMTAAEPARKPTRGRPKQTQEAADQKRQEIVAAAYEVFLEKGYNAAGIADIAARLGLGHGTFYRYFANKRDILDHVIDFGIGQIMTLISIDHLDRVTSPSELRVALTRIGDELFTRAIDADPRLPRLLLLEAGAIDEELLNRVFSLMDTVVVTISIGLDTAVDNGLLRRGLDTESAARALLGCAISAFLAEARSPLGADRRRRYVDTVVSLICDNAGPADAATV
ncbi:MAG TPA: TetR/AcrR family transcriptional regulator [Nocardioidaceae bacterium]|nr:TetR/AcrR family transcriptional regulator [Nocardioidaceae bacterium]